ncbi:four-carbon acid sugar kinase family protein [Paracoccus thiocyanatus]|uniref:Type III effector Hop protein n=1 Tax=Paracoccus thiocyanatus TaxID=34006 RepID=A0A3D8PCV4_9RHOB|nr:four-carbon acid sugar kinase family protein [Paracoccus thiocyanatus]RDW13277.1 type III effector Hop protein [Paracoccus thiocyanatus]
MAYIFVADDFTGASDTLATLSRAGMRARLFRDLPQPHDVVDLDAWGIATDARALETPAMAALAHRIGHGLSAFRPQLLHLKICSTFDSGAKVGNIALLAQGLADAIGIRDIAVIAGQPSLGRYAVFGTLFARGPDGQIHRIDRHPVMSTHPVTPMDEADLIRHLARLGLNDIELVRRGGRGSRFPRLYDALEQQDVVSAGRDLAASSDALLVMGSSAVAEAWLAAHPSQSAGTLSPLTASGPILVFAGSRSSLTTSQIAAAGGTACLPINPVDMIAGGPALQSSLDWACARLDSGQDCMLYLTAEGSGTIAPALLAERSAHFVHRLVSAGLAGGLIVAGGDTSSAIVTRLGPAWLEHAGDVCPGVPVLRARLEGGELPMILKGGQMGDKDFFAAAIQAIRS